MDNVVALFTPKSRGEVALKELVNNEDVDSLMCIARYTDDTVDIHGELDPAAIAYAIQLLTVLLHKNLTTPPPE
jgi:hypothetical protein